ncbi:MAG: hypothetical protein WAK78_11965 [Candidatus Acidiferrales bacterium]
MRLRVAQVLFSLVAFSSQFFFVENPPNNHGKSSDTIHFNAIVNVAGRQIYGGFALWRI